MSSTMLSTDVRLKKKKTDSVLYHRVTSAMAEVSLRNLRVRSSRGIT